MREGRFTIVDLFMVILAGILLALLLPSLRPHPPRESAMRTVCGRNLQSIGKAISMYRASYRDRYPHINGTTDGWLGDVGSADREKVGNPSADQAAMNLPVSRLMWLLVRDGHPTAWFICPSTLDMECAKVQHPDPDNPDKLIYYWDFEPTRLTGGKIQCSYGFQVPAVDGKGKVLPGVDDNCDEMMPIMADRNPAGGQAGWQVDKEGDELCRYTSQNHTRGEYVNFLRAGGSVGNGSTPLCGTKTALRTAKGDGFLGDHIFTASNSKADGSAASTDETAATHLNNVKDSFLYIQKVPDGT